MRGDFAKQTFNIAPNCYYERPQAVNSNLLPGNVTVHTCGAHSNRIQPMGSSPASKGFSIDYARWGMNDIVTVQIVCYIYESGRWMRESALSHCSGTQRGMLFQNVRSPKHSAFTLWYRTVAPPSSPWLSQQLKVPLRLRRLFCEQNTKGF